MISLVDKDEVVNVHLQDALTEESGRLRFVFNADVEPEHILSKENVTVTIFVGEDGRVGALEVE